MTRTENKVEFTHINNDVNGNPRFVCHFLALLNAGDHAYPTSITATKAGMGNAGCWFVSLYVYTSSFNRVKTLKYFKVQQEAETFAASLPYPFHFLHKYYHPSKATV